MALQFTEADSQVQVNGDVVPFVKCSVMDGDGDIVTNVASTGAGGVQVDHAQSLENRMSKVVITFRNTHDNMDDFKTWKRNIAGNTIAISSFLNTNFNRSYLNMSMTNTPEIESSTDGTFDVEFMGDPAL